MLFPFFFTEEEEREYFENLRKEEQKYNKRVIQDIAPKVVITKKIPITWALAINLFNKVYARRELTDIELQHETIHSLQMKKLGYSKFYIKYLYEWIRNYKRYKDWYIAYKNISFEKEAYTYQSDIDYIVNMF